MSESCPNVSGQSECPKVTGIIPCHNHTAWVWDAVDSMARQDYQNKKIIVVDDGSTDGSHEAVISRLYKPRQGKVNGLKGQPACWVGSVPNNGTELLLIRYDKASGPSFARNRGMEVAAQAHQAEIFAFLDSDDLYEPGKLSKSVSKIVEAPDHVGAVYTDYDTLRPDGLRLRQFKEPFSRARLLQECIINCDSVVSKKAIETCDGFDESLRVVEDMDLWLRLSERYMIMHIPESLVTIRVGEHSSTTTVKSEMWQACYARVMEKLIERGGHA